MSTTTPIKESAESATIEPQVEIQDLSGNGKIFKSLSENLTRLAKASDDFITSFGEALSKKIWLGFINPSTGEIASFIYRDKDGNIDDSLSFKMWLASSPSKGGLGLDNLGMIENLLKGNRQIFDQAMPLLLDSKSLRQCNEIREGRGEKPLISLSKNKEFYLKRITEAPNPHFSNWYQKGIPYTLLGKCASSYLKINSKERLEIDVELDRLANSEKNDALLQQKLSELFDVPILKQITLNYDDPYLSAKKIADSFEETDKEFLSQLISHLNSLMKDKIKQ